MWRYFPGFNVVFRQALRRHSLRSHVEATYGPVAPPPTMSDDDNDDDDDVVVTPATPATGGGDTSDASSDIMDESGTMEGLSSRLHQIASEHVFTYRITKAATEHARTPFDFFVVLLESKLVQFFRQHTALREICDQLPDGFYQVDLDDVYPNIRELRDLRARDDAPASFHAFVASVEDLFRDAYAQMDAEIASAAGVQYSTLWYYFDQAGKLFSVPAWYGHRYCYVHKSYTYERGRHCRFVATGTVVGYDEKCARTTFTVSTSIPEYKGRRTLESLPIQVVTDPEPFREAGRRTQELLQRAKREAGVQMRLRGIQLFLARSGGVRVYRDQRCMVSSEHKNEDLFTDLFPIYRDVAPIREHESGGGEAVLTLARLLESFDDDGSGGDGASAAGGTDGAVVDKRQTVAEEELACILPFVPIFNLGATKVWGVAHVGDLTPVQYKTHSFADLAMDEDRKAMIRHLVTYHQRHAVQRAAAATTTSAAIVDDDASAAVGKEDEKDAEMSKGKGLLFMLHGPPGVGKTLTAETVADHLRTPLYVVSSADISLETSSIEQSLTDIQRLCRAWRAVMLIDEADIFLEQRDLRDIGRNAVVATFLRFLEYTENVIFLTTNRLKTLDPAIRSRIHLILSYTPLTEPQRTQIWHRALRDMLADHHLAGEDDAGDVDQLVRNDLAPLDLNGREIHNVCRTALASLFEEHREEPRKARARKRILRRVRLIIDTNRQYEDRQTQARMYM